MNILLIGRQDRCRDRACAWCNATAARIALLWSKLVARNVKAGER